MIPPTPDPAPTGQPPTASAPPAGRWAKCREGLHRWRSRFADWLEQWRIIGQFLKPTTLQLAAALLPAVAYVFVDQGAEILSMMAEAWSLEKDGHWLGGLLFVLGSTGAGLTVWWSARVLLEFAWQPPVPPSKGWFLWLRGVLQRYWPRFLGVLPVWLLGVAHFVRVRRYASSGFKDGAGPLIVQGIGFILIGFLLLVFFHYRRKWLKKPSAPSYGDWKTLYAESPGSRWTHWSLLALSALTLLALWISPEVVAPVVGTGAILSLSAIAAVTVGTRLMLWQVRLRIPIFTPILVWVALNSLWMDNHKIRLSPATTVLEEGETLDRSARRWIAPPPTPTPGATDRPTPIFLVATEGGGIRAAYWTATVLTYLEERSRLPRRDAAGVERPGTPFAGHCFAISGVSGGSVGAAVFAALLADGRETLLADAQAVLGADHLAPLVGGLLFPDALQRALPVACPGTDRGAALERSWERAYRAQVKSNTLAAPFRSLWQPRDGGAAPRIPHLFLNATAVNTGQRVVFSDLAVAAPPPSSTAGGPADGLLDVLDARDLIYSQGLAGLERRDIPVSAAAHASARFTYTNPAGLLPSGQRAVDGGYFENSGSATLLEILKVLKRQPEIMKEPKRFPIVVIIISNDPQRRQEGDRETFKAEGARELQAQRALALQGAALALPASTPAPPPPRSLDYLKTKPRAFCSELLSPLWALLHTREARGSLALQTLFEEHAPPISDPLTRDESVQDETVRFYVEDRGVPLPLGWSLSRQAAEDLRGQMEQWGNKRALRQVLRRLDPADLPN